MTNAYNFAQFDPRPQGAEVNEAVFDGGAAGVLGIEVTIPALAARCGLGNIDPQHAAEDYILCGECSARVAKGDVVRNTGGFDACPQCGQANFQGSAEPPAAIEAALTFELPPAGAVLATVRADPDAVGAMAVIAMRTDGVDLTAAKDRVALIAAADKAASGPWPGQRPLPSASDPWPGGVTPSYAAVGAMCTDFKLPLEERVALMRDWLLTGAEPAGYRTRVEAERAEMIRALKAGEIKVDLVNGIAVVKSTHRAAMAVGYARAPVVVAENPTFRVAGGESHRKVTIAAYGPGYVDIRSALDTLAAREPGWGGSPTIGGSPQGVSSELSLEDVVQVVDAAMQTK